MEDDRTVHAHLCVRVWVQGPRCKCCFSLSLSLSLSLCVYVCVHVCDATFPVG